MATTVAASRKHVELSLELKRKLIQEHEHGVPFTLLGKKYHIATSTAANIWRKKDFFLRSRMSGSRKRCNDRSKYKIVNQVTALFVKSMLERNHKIDGEVIKRFARTAAAQCNFKDFHGSNGWLDSFKKRENVCWVRRRGGASGESTRPLEATSGSAIVSAVVDASGQSIASGANPAPAALVASSSAALRSDSPNLSTAAAAAAVAATAQHQEHQHHHHQHHSHHLQQAHHSQHHYNHNHNHNHRSISHSPHSCWEAEQDCGEPEMVTASGGGCSRCSVAAAAAAVAALNSSDNIHERDHEIEDWFHGIPFLCQFFEEYQSMHQQVEPSTSASVSVNMGVAMVGGPPPLSGSASSGALVSAGCQSKPTSSSSSCSVASSSCSSSASSSACSSANSLVAAGANATINSATANTSHNPNHRHHNHRHHQQHQQTQQQQPMVTCCRPTADMNQATTAATTASQAVAASGVGGGGATPAASCIMRSLSDAHELMDTSLSFKASASMADIQSLCAVGGATGSEQTIQRTISTEILTTTTTTTASVNKQPTNEHQQPIPPHHHHHHQPQQHHHHHQQQQQQQQPRQLSHHPQQQYNGLSYEPKQFQQPPDGSRAESFSLSNGQSAVSQADAGDQLMDINFTNADDSAAVQHQDARQAQHQQQQQQHELTCRRTENSHQMDCLATSPIKNESGCCQMSSCPSSHQQRVANGKSICEQNSSNGGHCAMTISSDYNSDDQEFYMQTARFIPQDAQSDDLLYHDEVSDHNDCCSDHYDQGGSGCELQLQDYQAELVNSANACYTDEEYEYANISTIRHYPVPMPPAASQQSGGPLAGAATRGDDGTFTSRGRQQMAQAINCQQQQQQQQQHLGHQQFISNNMSSNSHAAAAAAAAASGGAADSQDANGYLQAAQQQQQQQQQQRDPHQHPTAGANSTALMNPSAPATNGATPGVAGQSGEDHYSSLVGMHLDQESVEHADHEEHNLLHNALMRSPEKLKLIDSIITLLNYASNYDQKMLAPLLEIKRCIERDLEVVLSDTSNATNNHHHNHHHHNHNNVNGSSGCAGGSSSSATPSKTTSSPLGEAQLE